MWNYRASVIRVVDGDTVDIKVDLGFDILTNMRVRVLGIDTPEINAADPALRERAHAAKARVEGLLPPGTAVEITTEKDRREKYGRYLASIKLPDAADLAALLLQEGFAVAYDGGAR